MSDEDDPRPYDPEELDDEKELDELDGEIHEARHDTEETDDDTELPEGTPRGLPLSNSEGLEGEPERRDLLNPDQADGSGDE